MAGDSDLNYGLTLMLLPCRDTHAEPDSNDDNASGF